jgi:phosphoribosylanthranilate isomerase
MTWIKICGTTNLADALLAVEAGADAIGFIFAKSRRHIEPQAARAIADALPPRIEKIGVFVDEHPEQVRDIVAQAALTGVDLHGEEDESTRNLLHAAPVEGRRIRVFKTLHMGEAKEMEFAHTRILAGLYDALLLDSGNHEQRGGTGKTFDWDATEKLIRLISVTARVIFAGGLNPQNVAQAITRFRPWGVDVVSGVEAEIGRKDPEKVRAFIDAVRAAEASIGTAGGR